MSSESLKEDCEATVERAESVASDVYLLKDPLLKDDDEQVNSDSLDGGSDDTDSAEAKPENRLNCRCRHQCGLAVVFATVVGVFVVAAVVVVVILSVTSLQHPDVVSEPEGQSGWDETISTDDDNIQTTTPSRPVVLVSMSETCMMNIVGVAENGMLAYKGIPYAQPPTGRMRWRHPVPYVEQNAQCKKSKTLLQVYDAKQFGSKCMQLENDGQTISGSEDCLFLNIWTPSDTGITDSNRDVLVHFHGGGLMTGSGHEIESLPTSQLLRESNAIFVSFNYRLNVFGYLSAEALTATSGVNASGNYGLMDQILALQWVQRNIRSFGGNPNNVMLFGHGSGATSIYALLASSLARGLFHKVWMSNPSPKLQSFRSEAEQQNIHFVNNTNCADENHDFFAVSFCLRSMTAEAVLHALPWSQWLNGHFYQIPTVGETSMIITNIDGFVLKEPPLLAWQRKTFQDVPLLISSAAQATDVHKLNDWQQYNYADYVHQRLMSFTDIDIERVYELYNIRSPASDPELSDATLVSDIRATCPIDEIARVAAQASNSPVYRFQTKYNSTAHNSSSKNYAYSGIDIHAFFNSAESSSSPTWVQFVRNIRSIVLTFVHTGAVRNWQQFPNATYNVSHVISTASKPRFQSQQCVYWREYGFFPEYAWMN